MRIGDRLEPGVARTSKRYRYIREGYVGAESYLAGNASGISSHHSGAKKQAAKE